MAATTAGTRQQHTHSRLRSSSDPFVDPTPRSSRQHQRPPPPPPKSAKMPAAVSKNSGSNDITEAVRDTVTLRTQQESPRAKITRTQTGVPVSNSRPPGKRSQSEDSGAIAEKPRPSSGKGKSSSKKGSQHADVIDRLDFTGVGPMFHHDGPFDACAPSRNKQRSKAPMYAWGTEELAAPRYGDSAYPAPGAYGVFSNDYPEQPKKKVDAIAEAWGMHEPEPFEDFSAGGGTGRQEGDTPTSSIYNGRERNAHPTRRPLKDRDNRAARMSVMPPPQPIFVGGELTDMEAPQGSPPPSSPGFPKRSKSLMQRIRKMRDAPNVPVGPDYGEQQPVSPTFPTDPNGNSGSARPTHKAQNSFLGRFGGSKSPNSDRSEPFVFIDAHTNKDLPTPPATSGDYFDAQQAANGTIPPSTNGLGRKTSLMKKVGRVVRGTK